MDKNLQSQIQALATAKFTPSKYRKLQKELFLLQGKQSIAKELDQLERIRRRWETNMTFLRIELSPAQGAAIAYVAYAKALLVKHKRFMANMGMDILTRDYSITTEVKIRIESSAGVRDFIRVTSEVKTGVWLLFLAYFTKYRTYRIDTSKRKFDLKLTTRPKLTYSSGLQRCSFVLSNPTLTEHIIGISSDTKVDPISIPKLYDYWWPEPWASYNNTGNLMFTRQTDAQGNEIKYTWRYGRLPHTFVVDSTFSRLGTPRRAAHIQDKKDDPNLLLRINIYGFEKKLSVGSSEYYIAYQTEDNFLSKKMTLIRYDIPKGKYTSTSSYIFVSSVHKEKRDNPYRDTYKNTLTIGTKTTSKDVDVIMYGYAGEHFITQTDYVWNEDHSESFGSSLIYESRAVNFGWIWDSSCSSLRRYWATAVKYGKHYVLNAKSGYRRGTWAVDVFGIKIPCHSNQTYHNSNDTRYLSEEYAAEDGMGSQCDSTPNLGDEYKRPEFYHTYQKSTSSSSESSQFSALLDYDYDPATGNAIFVYARVTNTSTSGRTCTMQAGWGEFDLREIPESIEIQNESTVQRTFHLVYKIGDRHWEIDLPGKLISKTISTKDQSYMMWTSTTLPTRFSLYVSNIYMAYTYVYGSIDFPRTYNFTPSYRVVGIINVGDPNLKVGHSDEWRDDQLPAEPDPPGGPPPPPIPMFDAMAVGIHNAGAHTSRYEV